MKLVRAKVKPELLVWARESSGFTVEDAARKIRQPAERLAAWEAGEQQPTINQLRRLANAYKHALSVFYLSKAPEVFEPMHDFRRLPGSTAEQYSSALKMEIRGVYQRRQLALDLFEELDQNPPRFSLRARLSDDPEAVAERSARKLQELAPESRGPWCARVSGDQRAHCRNAWFFHRRN